MSMMEAELDYSASMDRELAGYTRAEIPDGKCNRQNTKESDWRKGQNIKPPQQSDAGVD